MPRAGYRKPTSKKRLREMYQNELNSLPEGDSKRLAVLRMLARLEGYDTRLKSTDYPGRSHDKKPPEPAAESDEMSAALIEVIEAADAHERGWKAFFAGEPLPDDCPALIRAVRATNDWNRTHPGDTRLPSDFQFAGDGFSPTPKHRAPVR